MNELGAVGILGAGQLAMMLSHAAANLGVQTVVFAPDQALLRPVGDRLIKGELTDVEQLGRFADQVDVITFETENISIEAIEAIGDRCLVRPSVEAVRVAQDRLLEKRFIASTGGQTAPYVVLDPGDGSEDQLRVAATKALEDIELPAIIKTRRMGYDGKGQIRLDASTDVDQLIEAWKALNTVGCIVEGFVAFDSELSVVAARGIDGSFVSFDPGTNVHVDGILRTTTVPATAPQDAVQTAVELTRTMLDTFDYVGVAGIEFFVASGEVLVNELAPRVHNSGHWTQLGCPIDQFEQHIRAITGRPLGSGARLAEVTMENLIGDDIEQVPNLAEDSAASIVLYGKAEVRPGRKMGHINRTST